MVQVDNDRCQQEMDETGYDVGRKLNVNALLTNACQCVTLILYMTQFSSSSFTNPEYELVAIYPEHFLPYGSVLPVFHSGTLTPTIYVSAEDQRLRESPEPDSPPLPTFHHAPESRSGFHHLNIFLVILNAEIKFHRYLHMISQNPPAKPLPADVLSLMHLTVELVHLLYWRPVPTKGSEGEAVAKSRPNLGHRFGRKFILPPDMDLETRKAYGRALMSGHGAQPSLLSLSIQSSEYVYLDRDYDPALFGDTISINDGVFFLPR
jgi:hypothetical protein